MPLLNGTALLNLRPRHQMAIPSLDSSGGNLDIIIGIFSGLQETKASAFVSSTPSSIKTYLGFKKYVAILTEIANDFEVDFAIHLDHCAQLEDLKVALDCGFTSVMYDGSHLPLANNIELSRKAVCLAQTYGASVEAELGLIGGKEDDLSVNTSHFPTIEECKLFVEETQIDIFAPAIGTLHGVYKEKPCLQWGLVDSLNTQVNMPLCLHGGSGVDYHSFKRLINKSFLKFNFATDLRIAFRHGIADSLAKTPDHNKPQEYLKAARQKVKDYVVSLINSVFITKG